MTATDLLAEMDRYNAAEKAILECFGVPDDWSPLVIFDDRNHYWMLAEDTLAYAFEPLTEEVISDGQRIYSTEIEEDRVYRREGLALVWGIMDGGGDAYFLFDEAKETTDDALRKVWLNQWGD